MSQFHVMKNAYNSWAANTDLSALFEPELTPDGTGYLIKYTKDSEQAGLLKTISTANQIKNINLDAFMFDNLVMFTEPDENQSPAERGFPTHPSENQADEFAQLYDGTYATMNYVVNGTSTWVFKSGVLKDANDIFVEDGFIAIALQYFPNGSVPQNESRYIYKGNSVLVHVWEITNVVTEQNGDITISMNIPA